MKIEKFEDIIAWQKAKILTTNIYSTFKDSKDFSFRDQIQRASVSIMNNIAEGFERKGDRELGKFLFIANRIEILKQSLFIGLFHASIIPLHWNIRLRRCMV